MMDPTGFAPFDLILLHLYFSVTPWLRGERL